MTVAIVAVLVAGPVSGDEGIDLSGEVARAESLLAEGEARQAIERLKVLRDLEPSSATLARLLAKAYVADGNPFWAERTLAAALGHDAEDWETRSWLIWLHVSQGDLDLARSTRARTAEPTSDLGRARLALLDALIAHTAGDDDATRAALTAASRARTMFSEDRALWQGLRRAVEPGWGLPLAVATDLELGHTSNALAGSPTDPGESGEPSPLAEIDLRARLTMTEWSPRPSLEVMVRGTGIDDDSARELSSLQLTARPGLVIGRKRPLLIAYRGERLLLNQDTSQYFDGHRVEAELELAGLTVFAGGGRRTFRDPRRSRDEVDGGVGGAVELAEGVPLLIAGALRCHDADSPVYDLRGATALAAVRFKPGRRLLARFGLTLSYDDYLNSGGYPGLEVFGSERARRDLLTRASVELWRPWRDLRLGLRYEYAHRDSTLDTGLGSDYSYHEHRVMALVRWRLELDPWGPAAASDRVHVALDYGLEGLDLGGDVERIQDLLRQDEEIRRGSACSTGP